MGRRFNGMETHRLARGLGWFSIGLGVVEIFAAGAVARFFGSRREDVVRAFGVREVATGVGLLATNSPRPWLWARVAGDVLDAAALGALFVAGRSCPVRIAGGKAFVAGALALDVWAATRGGRTNGSHVVRSATIGKPAAELYEFWRDPEKLALIMGHIAEVTAAGPKATRWTLKAPGRTVSWRSEYADERPGELLRWHSGEGEPVESDGVVRFEPAPGDRGTVVRLNFHIAPRGGRAVKAAMRALSPVPEVIAARALRRFKSLVETGELPTLEKNPSGRHGATANLY